MSKRSDRSIDPMEPVWEIAGIFVLLGPIPLFFAFLTGNPFPLLAFAGIFALIASISFFVRLVNPRDDPRAGNRPLDPP